MRVISAIVSLAVAAGDTSATTTSAPTTTAPVTTTAAPAATAPSAGSLLARNLAATQSSSRGRQLAPECNVATSEEWKGEIDGCAHCCNDDDGPTGHDSAEQNPNYTCDHFKIRDGDHWCGCQPDGQWNAWGGACGR